MKKWKAILFGTLLTLSLCTFTACGTEVNNADETVDEKNNDERNKKKNTNENTATENGIMEDETDNDGVMDNGGIIEDSGTDNNEMAGGNITVTPTGDGNMQRQRREQRVSMEQKTEPKMTERYPVSWVTV